MPDAAQGPRATHSDRERLPATFRWLFAGAVVNALATFVFPFLALYLTSRGFSLAEAGLLVALFGGGSIVSGPVAGHLADRVGRRPVMLASLVASGALTALLATVESPRGLVLATLALGLATHGFRPALGATVADVVRPEHRTRAFGLVYWANNLGMAVSLVSGGLLASIGYRWLFFADAATTLAFAAIVFLKVPETQPVSAGCGEPSREPGFGAALADRPFAVLLLLHIGFLLPFAQFQVAAPVDMVARGLSTATFGRVLAVNGFLIAALQGPVAARVQRLDAARVLAAAAALVGVGYGSYALCTSPWHFAAATAIWTLGEILALPTASALVAALAPAHLRGRYQGLYSLAFGLGFSAAPALGSALMQRFGSGALWCASFGAGLLVALGHLAAAGSRRRRLARGQPFAGPTPTST